METLHATLLALCPNKSMPSIQNIIKPATIAVVPPPVVVAPPARPMSVPTAAALKMGVGFPLTNLPGTNEDTNRILSTQCQINSKLMHECGICKRCTDQHLLAKCDTCTLHYHLGCLNPPLTRHPKKSKLYGWQCSECVKSDDSDGAVPMAVGPRKSRTKYSKDGTIVPVDPSLFLDFSSEQQSPPRFLEADPDALKLKVLTSKSPAKTTLKMDAIPAEPTEPVICSDVVDACNETTAPIQPQIVSKKRAPKGKVSKIPDKNEIILVDAVPANDELLSEPIVSDDPLDISNNDVIIKTNSTIESVVEPDTRPSSAVMLAPKAKSQKKTKKDKDPQPSYYVDKNGVLSSIDTLPQAGHFTSELITNNSSSSQPTPEEVATNKQNRKRRKEKHRNKHGSDSERQASKEHKKKRKKERHDMENPNNGSTGGSSAGAEGIPRIKIKVRP